MNTKRPFEIESWALQILDAVAAGKAVEDARVELKKLLPDPKKAARRIAGHANAARGDCALWIIGVDETAGLVGYEETEDFAVWWAKACAEFDGRVHPTLCHDLHVPYGTKRFRVLCFETDRAPYVVKNPNGGGIDREVPWREGTAVRSATREDLLRLLAPIATLPDVEFLNADLQVGPRDPEQAQSHEHCVACDLRLYVVPTDGVRLVVPKHLCAATIRWGIDEFEPSNYISTTLPGVKNQQSGILARSRGVAPSVQVHAGQAAQEQNQYQCSFSEPAIVEIYARWPEPQEARAMATNALDIEFVLGFAGRFTRGISICLRFQRDTAGKLSLCKSIIT